MAEQATCRRCSECLGEEHHFLDSCTNDDGNPVEPHFVCKHCEEKAGYCDERGGPIYPFAGQSCCADCTAERGDFD